MIWYDMIWYAMILYCMIWYDMMCYYDDIIRKPQRWPSLNDRPVHTNIYSSYTTCIHSIHSIHSVFQPVPMNQTAGDLNTPTRRMRWYDTCLDCCWVLLSVESVDTSEPNATAVQSLGNSRPSLKVERPQARHKQDTSKTQARRKQDTIPKAWRVRFSQPVCLILVSILLLSTSYATAVSLLWARSSSWYEVVEAIELWTEQIVGTA